MELEAGSGDLLHISAEFQDYIYLWVLETNWDQQYIEINKKLISLKNMINIKDLVNLIETFQLK